jgi:hypothetical protein
MFACHDPEGEWIRDTTLELALAEQWCNGCHQPRARWGPVCGGMTQGDMTHYHSPEWWVAYTERQFQERNR